MAQMSATDKIDVSIEHKQATLDDGAAKKHPNTCPGCGSHYRDDELQSTCAFAPSAPITSRSGVASASSSSSTPAASSRTRPHCARAIRSSSSTSAVHGASRRSRGVDRSRRCDDHRHRADRAASVPAGRHGLLVHGRLDGERRRREVRPSLRPRRRRRPSARLGVLLGRCPDAGGDPGVDAAAKTICALEELHEAGGVMISVLAHPTTGGLLASFASLGDVLLAEPGALMSFAGPRVVAQTTREKLPDDFGLRRVEPPLRPHRPHRGKIGVAAGLAQLIRLFGKTP